MRKSPFSTPRGGSRGGINWQSNERHDGRGYPNQAGHNFTPINSPVIQLNNSINDGDFIAFNHTNQSPSTPQRSNYYRGRGRGNQFFNSPGYHNRGNNSFTPRGHYSPYNQRGWNKNSNNRGGSDREKNRDMPASKFINISSCYEDPWKDLMDQNNIDVVDVKAILIDTKNNSDDTIKVDDNTLGNNIDKLESNL